MFNIPCIGRTGCLISCLTLCLICGCRWHHREECCPTDIKDTYGPFSSEAVRRVPCGPDEYNFGVKPTVWRCGPSDHPPAPAPCPDGGNWQAQRVTPHAPLELPPMPSEEIEPVPSTLPAPSPSFPMETQAAVQPISQVGMEVPESPPKKLSPPTHSPPSRKGRIQCNIPVRPSRD